MLSSTSSESTVTNEAVDKAALLASPAPLSISSPTRLQRVSQRAAFIAMAVLSVLVALASYRYLVPAARFTLSPEILANVFARPFLYIHAGCAATVLLVGPFQFSKSLRRRYLNVHRVLGRVYVLGCLVGGLAAMPLGLASTAGPWAQSGFFVLAVLWMVVNGNGWRLAVLGRISEHKQWMVRSFALTFAAVTLRLIIVILPALGVPFITAYRFSAWGSWVPNLLIVEAWMWYHSTAATVADVKAARPAGMGAATSESNTTQLTTPLSALQVAD